MRRRQRAALFSAAFAVVLTVAAFAPQAVARELNGFAIDDASIPLREIRRGGPPRDGIPALFSPPTEAPELSRLADDDMVIGVKLGNETRAYPVPILMWHELVNDVLGGTPILVSFCPLCGTGIVFDRRIAGTTHRFGVSGLLYQSDMLMYDLESESLWSQIAARGVTGEARDRRLRLVRSKMETWGEWKRAHPETRVLSTRTGYARDYRRSPYAGYDRSRKLFFPAPKDPRYHPKMRTLGLRVPGGPSRAYPLQEVQRAGGDVEETFAGQRVRVRARGESGVFDVEAAAPIEVIEGFWFAWTAFHRDTSVFVAPEADDTNEESDTQK
jgi:hypothetical protein